MTIILTNVGVTKENVIMIVTFCGHREVNEPETVKGWLEEVVDSLIHEGADTFYLK